MWRGRPAYELLEHTADAGVRVRAATLEELFEKTAAAMYDLIADVDAVAHDLFRGAIVDEIRVEALDTETLLVAWLGEVLSLGMVGGILFGAFEVRTLTETTLEARAWGKTLDARVHRFRTELKAVTYHDLSVRREGGEWVAQVIFDV